MPTYMQIGCGYDHRIINFSRSFFFHTYVCRVVSVLLTSTVMCCKPDHHTVFAGFIRI